MLGGWDLSFIFCIARSGSYDGFEVERQIAVGDRHNRHFAISCVIACDAAFLAFYQIRIGLELSEPGEQRKNEKTGKASAFSVFNKATINTAFVGGFLLSDY